MHATLSEVGVSEAIKSLIEDYNELNQPTVDELVEEPTPLEFMRYVARNRPFVVRKAATEWEACKRWNKEYLSSMLGDSLVKVALTPRGNADSPLVSENGKLLFVKPHEIYLPFRDAIEKIVQQESDQTIEGPVMYCQTQNDNMRDEYHQLHRDIPESIAFARIALEKEPDAINFWLGNSRSVTALHKDPYENIFVQVTGRKHLILLSPICTPCVNEQKLQAATYRPIKTKSDTTELFKLVAELDEPKELVPFATWDPQMPQANITPYSSLAEQLHVTLEPGDMLYLPSMWYHRVSLSCGADEFCCSVNYWFDMEFSGSFFPLCSFVRQISWLQAPHG